jgi:hypothetical protein
VGRLNHAFLDSTNIHRHGQAEERLTSARRAARKRRKKDSMIVFMNGKQVRVRREPTMDGMDTDEFIRQNADSIWLRQNGCYESLLAQTLKGG